MLEFFTLIKNLIISIIDEFAKHPISVGGYKVSFFALVFSFLVIGFVISYFWKGAKT